MNGNPSRAQSTLEYGVVLAVVVAALVTMQLYFKRGIQATIKTAADEIGAQEDGDIVYTSNFTALRGNSVSHLETATEGAESTGVYKGGARSRNFSTTTRATGNAQEFSEQEDK
jgi:uncharacterized protein (UPF0333 family)